LFRSFHLTCCTEEIFLERRPRRQARLAEEAGAEIVPPEAGPGRDAQGPAKVSGLGVSSGQPAAPTVDRAFSSLDASFLAKQKRQKQEKELLGCEEVGASTLRIIDMNLPGSKDPNE
jgi:hypothetical protein